MIGRLKNNKAFVLLLLTGAVYFFLEYITPLIAPVLTAMLFVTIFGPTMKKMQEKLCIHRQISAIILLLFAGAVLISLIWILFSWIVGSLPGWIDGLDAAYDDIRVIVHSVCEAVGGVIGVDSLYLENTILSRIQEGIEYFQLQTVPGMLSQSWEYVKAAGGMAPVSQFVTLTKTYGAESLARFNMFSSIGVNGMPADGYSSGDAINAIKEVAAQTLPVGYGYEFSGMTREEAEMAGSNSTVMIYAVCVLLIYLILCALYESLFVPFAVILSVPFGLMGSFLFARFWGIENNIYLQTGLIMLIGLLSKTAILLTEYATEAREKGMSLTDAAIEAASVRFRPILMTVLTMIFGMLPLMFASGVGANGNNSLGVGVVGGLLIGSLALLFVTPAFFIVFQYIEEKVMGQRKEDRK